MRSNTWWNMDRFAKEYMNLISWNGAIDAVDAALYAKKKMQELERGSKMNRDICKEIKNVKFNPPATIVFWTDNTKTVVKCNGEDEFDGAIKNGVFIPIENPSVVDFIKSGNMSGATHRYRELHNCKLKEAYDAVYEMKRYMHSLGKKSNKEEKCDEE